LRVSPTRRVADYIVAPCYNRRSWEREADITRILVALASALALPGCMTQMPESDYQDIAIRVAQASICKREQMMGVDQFNHYVVFQTRGYPSQYLYDQSRLGSMVQDSLSRASVTELSDSDRPIMEVACANLAIVADRLGANMQPAAAAPQVPIYTPRYTNCITNYGYTTCSSY